MIDFKNGIGKRNKLILLAAISALIVAVLWLLVSMMQRSIDTSVYAERKELLGRLTETSASAIDDNINYGQSIMNMVADDAANEIPEYPSISAYINDVKTRPSYSELYFFFVDENGKYFSSDDVYGKITDTTYYTNESADELIYISSLPHLDVDKVYMVFRNRLPQPLKVNTDFGKTTIEYCGLLFDIDGLKDSISEKFSGDSNTFIYDDSTGVMLYHNFGIRQLIDGFNIYPKFSSSDVIFGETPEELEAICHSRETLVVALRIDNEDYYFCSAPINHIGWSVAFIVRGKYLDTMSGSTFGVVVAYIAMIAIVLGIAVLMLIATTYRSAVNAQSLREITLLNDELERATNAKSDFLSNMSHDIRTPINGIMGMTTIAKNVEGNPEKTQQCLEKIDGASHHLLSLINDVLDMSRIERGKTEIAAKPIDIRMVCDNCSSIIGGQISDRQLALTSEISCEHPHLIGDDLHLRQILINILGNSVKFTPDGGNIRFRCIERDFTDTTTEIAFEIEDTGIGMSAEFIPKLFDAFTQDDGGARSSYKGTGLGMAITKQLTELMGGSINVESELGKGSKFTVTIPFKINPDQTTNAEFISDATDLNGIRLLLAEDNQLNMEIAVDLLEDAGAQITTVEDGKQALDVFMNSIPGAFDAILMDVMMPVMNGLDATRAIRSLPRVDAKSIPILAMTANAFESDIQATREAGMNAHLTKPININEVIKTIAYFTKMQ